MTQPKPYPPIKEAERITVRWKPGAQVLTISGQWERLPDGSIKATYTPDELQAVLNLAKTFGFENKDKFSMKPLVRGRKKE